MREDDTKCYNSSEGVRLVSYQDSGSASCLDTLTPNETFKEDINNEDINKDTNRSVPEIAVVGDQFVDETIVLGDKTKNYEGIPFHYKMKETILTPGGSGIVVDILRGLGNLVCNLSVNIPEVKRRYFLGDKLVSRVDLRNESFYSPPSILSDRTKKKLIEANYIVIVDYNKGGISPQVLKFIEEECYGSEKFVHTKDASNSIEYERLNPIFFTNQREWPVNRRYRGMVVQTLGSNGVRLLIDGTEFKHVKSKAKDPKTVIGAGDSVMAGFIDGIVKGNSYSEALEWCQVVSGEAMKGPYTCNIKENMLKWSWFYGKQMDS